MSNAFCCRIVRALASQFCSATRRLRASVLSCLAGVNSLVCFRFEVLGRIGAPEESRFLFPPCSLFFFNTFDRILFDAGEFENLCFLIGWANGLPSTLSEVLPCGLNGLAFLSAPNVKGKPPVLLPAFQGRSSENNNVVWFDRLTSGDEKSQSDKPSDFPRKIGCEFSSVFFGYGVRLYT